MSGTLTVEATLEALVRERGRAWIYGLRGGVTFAGRTLADRYSTFPEGFRRYHDLRIVNLGPHDPYPEIAVWMREQAWHGPVGLGYHTFANGYGLFTDARDELWFMMRWT